ncbi:hypothetical protein EXS57_02855 [Candidatus Kaiserbacteria bacterium]|nr:hypothetical protein [Candidatus Kaiserbacteria bacterium]
MRIPDGWVRTFEVGDEERISLFAMSFGDQNPIHHSNEKAREAGLLGAVAPGVMIGGFISATIAELIPGVRIGNLKMRFPKPLYAGSTAYVFCKLLKRSGQCAKISFEIKNGIEVVTEGSCLLLLPADVKKVA